MASTGLSQNSFADVATPLVTLTGKDVPFVWDSSCSTAFAALCAALMDAPILAFPTETGLYILFYWSGMSDDVKDWLSQCVACIKRKSPVGRHHPLGNIQ